MTGSEIFLLGNNIDLGAPIMFDILCSSTQLNLEFIRSNILLEECPLVPSVGTPLIFTTLKVFLLV